MDVGEAAAADGQTVPLRVHSLLLALAGRMDDSALTSAHELTARADVDEAAELTAGTLIAGRIPVSATERQELASILELSQCDPSLVDDLLVDELGSTWTHRFTGDATDYGSPETGVGNAIERVTRVLPDVRTVHAVWRLTPAGAIPGALPTRVLLVEVGAEGNPPAVAYRIDVALRRADIDAVVEVLSPRSGRSRYHESALMSAREVYGGEFADVPAAGSSGPREAVAPAPISYGPEAPRIAPTRAQRRTHRAEPAEHRVSTVTDTYQTKPAHHEADFPSEVETHRLPEPVSTPAPEPEPESMSDLERQATEPWESISQSQPELNGVAEPFEAAAAPEAAEPLEFPDNSGPWRSAFIEPAGGEGDAAPQQQEERQQAQREQDQDEPESEERVASTTEMTPAEIAQLRRALAEDPERGRQIAASVRPGEVVEIPELDLNDPQLSERDRELLRELHAELAARERADAGRHGVNGSMGS